MLPRSTWYTMQAKLSTIILREYFNSCIVLPFVQTRTDLHGFLQPTYQGKSAVFTHMDSLHKCMLACLSPEWSNYGRLWRVPRIPFIGTASHLECETILPGASKRPTSPISISKSRYVRGTSLNISRSCTLTMLSFVQFQTFNTFGFAMDPSASVHGHATAGVVGDLKMHDVMNGRSASSPSPRHAIHQRFRSILRNESSCMPIRLSVSNADISASRKKRKNIRKCRSMHSLTLILCMCICASRTVHSATQRDAKKRKLEDAAAEKVLAGRCVELSLVCM
jgi:hypothetical protein